MIVVKDNIHPWMRAYIGVLDHPFFAVTGDDGMFALGVLPAGDYTVTAWHEVYGKLTSKFPSPKIKSNTSVLPFTKSETCEISPVLPLHIRLASHRR